MSFKLTDFITVSNTGNVGIGTSSIEGKLTLNHTAAELPSSGTTSNSAIQIISSLNNQLNIGLNTVSGDYGSYIQASDNNLAVPYPLFLQPNGGNIGIGTLSPTNLSSQTSLTIQGASVSRLDLLGASGAGGGVVFGTATAFTVQANYGIPLVLDAGTTADMNFNIGGSTKLIISSNGQVGIGATPGGAFDVSYDAAALNAPRLTDTRAFAINNGAGLDFMGKVNTIGQTSRFGSIYGKKENSTDGNTDGYLQFQTNNVERMRISSTGDVGIGTSSPNSYFVRGGGLVVDSADAGSNIVILNDNNTFSSLFFAKGSTGAEKYQGYIEYEHANNAMAFGTAQVERMRITSTGDVLAANASTGGNLYVGRNGGNGSTAASQQELFLRAYSLYQTSDATYYGSYGFIQFNADNGWTSGARKFAITNGYLGTNFAILRSTSAREDIVLDGNGGATSTSIVDFTISNNGLATFFTPLKVSNASAQIILNDANSDSSGSSNEFVMTDYNNNEIFRISKIANTLDTEIANVLNGNLLFRTNNTVRLTISSGGAATFTSTISLGEMATIIVSDISTGENRGLRLENTGGGGKTWNVTPGLAGSNNSNFTIRNATDDVNALTISSAGNVTLAGYLQLGTSASQTILGDFGETNTYLINYNSGGTLKFLIGGGATENERLTITSGGRTEITTSSNDDTLILNNTGTYAGSISFNQRASNGTLSNAGYVGSIRAFEGSGTADNGVGVFSRTRMSFYINSSTPQLTIATKGIVGIGVTPKTDPFGFGSNQFQMLQFGGVGCIGSYDNAGEAMFSNNVYVSSTVGTFAPITTGNGSAIFCYTDRIDFKTASNQGNGTMALPRRVSIADGTTSGHSSGALELYGAITTLDNGNDAFVNHYLDTGNNYYISTGFKNTSQDIVITNSSAGVRLEYADTSWVSNSDENIKENIVSLDNVLDKIKNIRCVNYNLKDEEIYKKRLGFIAQDFQEDFEEVVGKSSDDILGLRYTETIPILMKAIQEQQAQIEELKSEIQLLKNN